jgi:hypothetical protein
MLDAAIVQIISDTTPTKYELLIERDEVKGDTYQYKALPQYSLIIYRDGSFQYIEKKRCETLLRTAIANEEQVLRQAREAL